MNEIDKVYIEPSKLTRSDDDDDVLQAKRRMNALRQRAYRERAKTTAQLHNRLMKNSSRQRSYRQRVKTASDKRELKLKNAL
jgi:hypothetical protein